MRLFVALEIPGAVRLAAAKMVEELRPAAPQARWARIEGIHITLKFIGHVKPEMLQPIEAALAEIRTGEIVHMDFKGLGFFPNERRPRVFWAGVQTSSSAGALAAKIDERLEPLEIARATRAFSPHLTLARFEEGSAVSKLIGEIEKLGSVELGEMTTREFHLFESETQRGGSHYTRLKTFDFVGRHAAGDSAHQSSAEGSE